MFKWVEKKEPGSALEGRLLLLCLCQSRPHRVTHLSAGEKLLAAKGSGRGMTKCWSLWGQGPRD